MNCMPLVYLKSLLPNPRLPKFSMLSCRSFIICLMSICLFVYLLMFIFERERTGEGQREGETGSETGSALTAESLIRGSNS